MEIVSDVFRHIIHYSFHLLAPFVFGKLFWKENWWKAGLIMVAGGMSVDPDDITRMAIMEAGAEDVVYGTPVLPGAMFLYGRIDKTPILGLPACVLFYKATILDLVMPRVLAGEGITRKDLALMAHGGLCLNCEHCQFPVCPFGK